MSSREMRARMIASSASKIEGVLHRLSIITKKDKERERERERKKRLNEENKQEREKDKDKEEKETKAMMLMTTRIVRRSSILL